MSTKSTIASPPVIGYTGKRAFRQGADVLAPNMVPPGRNSLHMCAYAMSKPLLG